MSDRSHLLDVLERMRGKRIVVYGDLVAHRFLYGVPKRISREAPVLILRQERDSIVPGGAGNAISNIQCLGGEPRPVSVVGSDYAGKQLLQVLSEMSIDTTQLIRVENYRTPTKTRILAGMPHAARQQIVRFDVEDELRPDASLHDRIKSSLETAMDGADALLISDYGYGVVAEDLVRQIIASAQGRPVALDSRHDLLRYPGVTIATPNEEEAATATKHDLWGLNEDHLLKAAGERLRTELRCPALLVTRGSRGMALFQRSADPIFIPVHGTDQVADVTGAGDTVIATLSLALAAGASFVDAALLANYAASIVVTKTGTAPVLRNELEVVLRSLPERSENGEAKLISFQQEMPDP